MSVYCPERQLLSASIVQRPHGDGRRCTCLQSATLDDQLQRMEERGMFSEVLQDALQGREQEREAHHGFLHRSLHRPSLQSAVNESRNAVSMNEAERRVLKNLRRSSAGGALSERRSILGYAFSLQ